MKYIKKFEFEAHTEDRYWKVSLDSPEYEISINKIVRGEDNRKKFLNKLVLLRGLYPDSKYFYLAEDNPRDSEKNITYHHSKFPFEHFIFMGKVNITKDEIDKWYMESDAEKYNL